MSGAHEAPHRVREEPQRIDLTCAADSGGALVWPGDHLRGTHAVTHQLFTCEGVHEYTHRYARSQNQSFNPPDVYNLLWLGRLQIS